MTRIIAILKNVVLAVALMAAFTGCNRDTTKKQSDRPKQATGFTESMFNEITPMVDGGAYAVALDSGLWYLRGSEALKVRLPDLPPDESEMFFLGVQITPLADGGAYAHTPMEKSFWYLREGTARKVAEVSVLTTKATSSEPPNGWLLYVMEREKRRRAERESEEREEYQDQEAPESP